MRAIAIALFVLFHSVTAAAAPAANEKAARDALKTGRALEKKGDFAGAVGALQRGLSSAPQEPNLLSELSVAALAAGNVALAEQSAKDAIKAATTDTLRGAAQFNLGRAQETRGDKAAAIISYTASLNTRANPIVRRKLATLDPVAAAAREDLAPVAMTGPMASLKTFCKQRAATNQEACDPANIVAKVNELQPPYKFVGVLETSTEEERPDKYYHLVIRTAAGWFVTSDVDDAPSQSNADSDFTVDKLELRDVIPGGAPEVLLYTSVDVYREASTRKLHVAGVGSSARPSCTPEILLEETSTDKRRDGDDNVHESADNVRERFLPGGALELIGKRKNPLVGTHRLVFP